MSRTSKPVPISSFLSLQGKVVGLCRELCRRFRNSGGPRSSVQV